MLQGIRKRGEEKYILCLGTVQRSKCSSSMEGGEAGEGRRKH